MLRRMSVVNTTIRRIYRVVDMGGLEPEGCLRRRPAPAGRFLITRASGLGWCAVRGEMCGKLDWTAQAEVCSYRKVNIPSEPETTEKRTLHLVQSVGEARIVLRHGGEYHDGTAREHYIPSR